MAIPSKIFVIGIGGTGMRCLESFVHMCSMGMCDGAKVVLLALDTDKDNGNFRRLKEVVKAYDKVKGIHRVHKPQKSTLFSAQLESFFFSPDYSRMDSDNFSSIVDLPELRQSNQGFADIANLLFSKRVQEFNLRHGYRAQTHLGSFLMYHAILEEVATNHVGDLAKFIISIHQELVANEKPRIFVMGSVFGGTGASSIPVIPKAFNEAINILQPGASLQEAYFGAVLLTSYFTFRNPSRQFRDNQYVVATSDKFALNSQAAMMFFNDDATVKRTYQKFYMLGLQRADFVTDKNETETITGGNRQENKPHFIELAAAFGAYHFFGSEEDELKSIRGDTKGVRYYYRTIDEGGRLGYPDFVPINAAEQFARKLGMLTVMSILVNHPKYDFAEAARSGTLGRNNIHEFSALDAEEVNGMKDYFAFFHFSTEADGSISDGWLRQLHQSAGGGDNFLLSGRLFAVENRKQMGEFKFNDQLYRDEFKQHKFSAGYFTSAFDGFKRELLKTKDPHDIDNISEKLVKRMYDALSVLYQFV
jgi:hypothetical protein